MRTPLGGGTIVSAYLIDRIVVRLGVVFERLPFTPNQVTLMSAAVGVAAGILFIFDQWLAGAISVFASMVLDGLDGEVARRKNMKSKYGAFLDTMMDRVVDTTVVLGVAYSSAKIYGDTAWIIGFLAAVYACVLSSYTRKLVAIATGTEPTWLDEKPKFTDGRDVRLLIITLGALGNLFVDWSALASVAIVLALSLSKFVIRLFIYRDKLE
ncbi:MAG TPA: CDP-alcohol phosphatidyltransferase family protein [Dehalococcoidia bacterium]|mgnify:FL=1|jgi:CDP-L-myo-inositol myo-inositolphosphotransferase|nr:CDP-alcohol phosphatidyltransferase family protein [Dehalococcoidia bacterium]HIA17329.1 CDP-alcohol phosphatidyltransferase family protein [Dehalococcoidia bacterium]HIM16426.1 CDP-alcohol phosphatidyltransferase family protein [Dehalococcoidia bacterium]HIN72318.1 CDP-alcohol phosphatidyltransferase family protein [Dehalococcoidia bacterium]HIO63706.1 CDP-alcohol phosphatidyltransferase family protein [Dehalococcoidia bacterium]